MSRTRIDVLLAAAAPAGCKLSLLSHDDTSTQGTGNSSNWSIAVAASRTDLSIQQGGTDTVVLTVTRSGGFTGPVLLTPHTENMPGITTGVSGESTTGTTTTVKLAVNVSTNVN